MAIKLALCGSELASVAGRTPHPFLGRETVYSGRRIRSARTDRSIGGRREDNCALFVSFSPNGLFLFYYFIFIFELKVGHHRAAIQRQHLCRWRRPLTQARRRVYTQQYSLGNSRSARINRPSCFRDAGLCWCEFPTCRLASATRRPPDQPPFGLATTLSTTCGHSTCLGIISTGVSHQDRMPNLG